LNACRKSRYGFTNRGGTIKDWIIDLNIDEDGLTFGDTLRNYVSGDTGYVVATPVVGPFSRGSVSGRSGGCFLQQVAQ
jgi:hypothetical protein